MVQHSFGWIKDKYNPQAVYHLPVVKVLLPSTNNRQYFPPVRYQDGVGICGGFSWAEHLETVCRQIGQPVDGFSENYIYNGSRYIEGTLNQDAGLANDDAIKWLVQHRFLLYPYWPFLNKLDSAAPSTLRESEANIYPNFQSFRVDNGVDGLKSAMADGHTVVLGSPWSQRWEEPTGEILPDPNGSISAGGHDTVWGDYDDSKQAFFGQNSWDTSWNGDLKGRFWMPYSAIQWFKDNGGYDAHYVVFTPLINPPPAPNPPASCGCPRAVTNMFRRMVKYNK